MVILFSVKYALMAEFKKRGLHIKYKKEIEEWFIYLDQKKFGKKLEKKMMTEVDRFVATKESTEALIERVFGKHEWEIEFLEDVEVMPKISGFVLEYA